MRCDRSTFPVQLRGPGFDVDVADAVVGQMPVEERLELMATVRADGVNPKRELLNHRVYEGDGVLLRVAAVDAQGPDAGGVVDGCCQVDEKLVDLPPRYWA